MAQRGNPRWGEIDPPFWVRPAPRQKRVYDLEVLPRNAQRAGHAWASDFGALSPHEQRAIVTRLTVERIRAMARRKGKPEPIFVEAVLKPLPGGGYVLDTETPYRPLRPEWGGMAEDESIQIAYPVPQDNTRGNPHAKAIVERHKRQLKAHEAKPERKARTS